MVKVPAEFPISDPGSFRLAIVGEAPGRWEEEARRPFVGASGQLLDRMLHASGVIRRRCLVTNVVKYRPADNNFESLPQDVIQSGVEELRSELDSFKPNCILALGAKPLYYLAGKEHISKWRGSIIPASSGHKLVATYHPAAVLREIKLAHIAQIDCQRAATQAWFPEIRRPHRLIKIRPSLAECLEYLDKLKDVPCYSFDIETGRDLSIMCLGFSTSSNEAFVIPLVDENGAYFSEDEEKLIWRAIAQALSLPCIKIMHNAMFELFTMQVRAGIEIKNPIFDTMLAAHSCYAEFPKALDFVSSIFTEEPYYKDDRHDWNPTKIGYETLWIYNGKDCAVTIECYEALKKELKELNAQATYELEASLLRPLLNASLQGIKVNKQLAEKKAAHLLSEINGLQRLLDGFAEEPLNVQSPKQMKEFLYGRCGLPVQYKKSSDARVPTTNQDALYSLMAKTGDIVVDLVLTLRKKKKELEFLTVNPDADGRLRTAFNIAGQETGRISSSQTLLGTGTNLQTVPDEHRDIYEADEGKTLVTADLEQAESWVTAYLIKHMTQDPILVNTLKIGVKIHRIIASTIILDWFPINEIATHLRSGTLPKDVYDKMQSIDKQSDEYFLGKQIGHAANYGLGHIKFAELVLKNTDGRLFITTQKAKHLIESYHSLFPAIRQWHLAIQAKLRESKQLVNPFGRQRIFMNRWGDDLFREAYAFIPQSTVPDIISQVIVRVANDCPYADVPFGVAHQHDSLMAQVSDEKLDEFIKILAFHFRNVPVTIGRDTFVIPVEIKAGKNWKSGRVING